jgi:quinoprotein dehydrogenase-associated probable ABC transporter substrate-binding protein
MSSAIKLLALLTAALAASVEAAAPPVLRICADPNNMPYSNELEQGFENELARMIAKDLGMVPSYTWLPQRSAFFDKTLEAGVCDVVLGVPSGMANVRTTRPYYRSGYVFVSRADRNLDIHSLDDPRLREVQIGVHLLGEGESDLPPVHALASRGIIRNLVGYNIFGNLEESNPASDLIKAVARGEVDLAVAWGPIAGYFARQSNVPLQVTIIDADPLNPSLPFGFSIGIGVQSKNRELEMRLDTELNRRKSEIVQLLAKFGIPQSVSPAVNREDH